MSRCQHRIVFGVTSSRSHVATRMMRRKANCIHTTDAPRTTQPQRVCISLVMPVWKIIGVLIALL